MAHSLQAVTSQPEGAFDHSASQARFTIRNTVNGLVQTVQQSAESESLPIRYIIGSGSHAYGYVAVAGDHLFQSPLSYYTVRRLWDIAPGYEQSTHPDFSRPLTAECLFCHADKPRPVANTLNTYQSPPFEGAGIQCDRCHGPAESHLKSPVVGSIVNPAKLPTRQRDSVCEQCHLTGELRIPNPGKATVDFQPGQTIEDTYTVYVTRATAENTIKVVSQVEQLALSICAARSNGKLWCGSCHNPHETPAQPAEYYRQKCLSCHAATLAPPHAALSRDCVACHMPPRPAKDGGHTAFTDHRIARYPGTPSGPPTKLTGELIAWREPDARLRQRSLAIALVTVGLQNQDSAQVLRGYKILNQLESQLSKDAAGLTSLGTVLLTAKQPLEASRRFERALALRPDYAPYEVNLAYALLDQNKTPAAIQHLERALQLDPLLQQAIQMLDHAYRQQGEPAKADELIKRYRAAMGFTK